MTSQQEFTVGVEEEFLLVDAESRRLRPQAEEVLCDAGRELGETGQLDQEFKRSQLEHGTAVCHSLEELGEEITRLRRTLMAAAERSGARIAASGTHPFSHWQEEGAQTTHKESYLGLERDYQRLAREKIICGCHVHVRIADPDFGIQVLDRVRPWLPAVLALSVNSPFWLGEDTGYASFRTEIWRRWPTAGIPEPFESRADYDRLVGVMLQTRCIDDPARLHWDVRPSQRYPTLEFRIADVCLTVDEAVTVAGLVRALVRTCHAEAVDGRPPSRPRAELLRMAVWRAARYGLEGDLIDVVGERSVPAPEMLAILLDYVRPALDEHDEWEAVSQVVDKIVQAGTGAVRQKRAFAGAGRLEDVVDFVVGSTESPAGASAPTVRLLR
ncbi:MAG TPA: carboxylate-amine ligase [Acidimicrobiales bacterium]|nr:carboxylate-amine ligase [Acidimicrobiales bacterium]